MKHLVGMRVSAIADCGTYKGRTVKGILSFYQITGQYLVKIGTRTVSVMEETIEQLNQNNTTGSNPVLTTIIKINFHICITVNVHWFNLFGNCFS